MKVPCATDSFGLPLASSMAVLSKVNNGDIPHSMTQEGKRKPRAAGSRRALVQKKRAGSRLRHLAGLGEAGPVPAPVVGRVPVGIRQVPQKSGRIEVSEVQHSAGLQEVDQRLV